MLGRTCSIRIAIHGSPLVIYNQDIKDLNHLVNEKEEKVRRKWFQNFQRPFSGQWGLETGVTCCLHETRQSSTSLSMPETCLLLNSLSVCSGYLEFWVKLLACRAPVPEMNHYTIEVDFCNLKPLKHPHRIENY